MVLVVGSIDTAEDVAVPLPVWIVMCNPPLPIPLHVRTDCKNCAKRKDELQRMANSVKLGWSTCKVPKATIWYWTQEDIKKEGKMKIYAYYSCLLTILLEIWFLLIFLTCEMPCFREHDIYTLGYIFLYRYHEQPAYLAWFYAKYLL